MKNKNHSKLMELGRKKGIAIAWLNTKGITCNEITFNEAIKRLRDIYIQIRNIKKERESYQIAMDVFKKEGGDDK